MERRDMAKWTDLPEGFYTVPDPRPEVEGMTYWRIKRSKRGSATFGPWPNKASYGPTLSRDLLPEGVKSSSMAGQQILREWFEREQKPYQDAIVDAIAEDPLAAMHRFAAFATHCMICGKALTHEYSKVVGIGPECRKGMSAERLAELAVPEVGRVHAEAQPE
jgi:Family of unknown function (DUF6011)